MNCKSQKYSQTYMEVFKNTTAPVISLPDAEFSGRTSNYFALDDF